jgi:iron complex transport system substrate-binding protein
MKTKTSSFGKAFLSKKRFALLEIAIVLCLVFLVAIPAIAAEQTQEMQKVSASANTITTASEDDYVLGIYGNANEDDTIDMRDLTYVKLIFFGKKPETELADAKYDEKINPLDFIQIKLIIVGKEKELTIVQYLGKSPDITEEAVTVSMPIKRIVATTSYCAEALCAFEEQDKIVGVTQYAKERGELKTFLEDVPSIGGFSWDMEKILELNPDIVLAYSYKSYPDREEILNAAGIPVVQMDFYRLKKNTREVRNLGWILGKKQRAEEIIDFVQQYLSLIKERMEDLEDEQKPQVYYESYREYKAFGPGSSYNDALVAGGGVNIFADLPTHSAEIDPEEVIRRDPQVILKALYSGIVPCGYDVTDTGPMEEFRNDIMRRPGWDHIDAVKNGRVYLISGDTEGMHSAIYYSYVAKMLHPELFADIDPIDIHREWSERFLGIKYKGVYAYPSYPVS